MDQLSTAEPTLDHQRTDQLRTFLTVEAAADAAASSTRAHRPGRRLLAGAAAAIVLGAGIFAATAVTGGPDSGPARVATANAVEIQQVEPGWTTISIADVDADPAAVVAELQAAGIDARQEPLDVQRDAEGRVTLRNDGEGLSAFESPPEGGFTMVGLGSVGAGGLAGLTVSAPGAGQVPVGEDATPEESAAAVHAYLEGIGARTGDHGSIEIRNDADLTVIVLSEG